MEDIVNILQFIGGVIMVLAVAPQLIKLAKTKSSKDFSLLWVCLIWIAVLLMEPYAIWLSREKSTHVFLITNTACLIVEAKLILDIIKYRRS